MRAPRTRYVRSGSVHIAYQTVGEGPLDLVWVPTWIWESEHVWEEPSVARFLTRLSGFARLITFDRRGSGLSDPVPEGAPTLEEQIDDVVAVLDAVGCQQAAVMAQFEAGAMATLFAAAHPDRTRALILYEATPRMTATEGYEWPLTREQREAHEPELLRSWGSGERVLALHRSRSDDPALRRWAGRLERLAASPATALAFYRMHNQIDVRPVLAQVQAPTLVLHRKADEYIDIRHSRYLAAHIPGARLVELAGDEALPFRGDQDALVAEVEEFLTGSRHEPDPERVLATVMFADIVESTRIAAELGDAGWRRKLSEVDRSVRAGLAAHRGRRVKTLGDGFLATFDGPARAIRCAAALREEAREGGLQVRCGLHTGEVEMMGEDVGGIAVHIGARVVAAAQAGEILVSGTVKDLVVGSGLSFTDRGERELKGVPGSWRLWAVAE